MFAAVRFPVRVGTLCLSENPVIYHRGGRRGRRVLRPFQSSLGFLMPLRAAFGDTSYSAYSAVKLKDMVVSLENPIVSEPCKHQSNFTIPQPRNVYMQTCHTILHVRTPELDNSYSIDHPDLFFQCATFFGYYRC